MNKVLSYANKEFKRRMAPLARDGYADNYKVIRAGVIQGHWHEDNNTFEITCPVQMQDILCEALNVLHLLEFKSEDESGKV